MLQKDQVRELKIGHLGRAKGPVMFENEYGQSMILEFAQVGQSMQIAQNMICSYSKGIIISAEKACWCCPPNRLLNVQSCGAGKIVIGNTGTLCVIDFTKGSFVLRNRALVAADTLVDITPADEICSHMVPPNEGGTMVRVSCSSPAHCIILNGKNDMFIHKLEKQEKYVVNIHCILGWTDTCEYEYGSHDMWTFTGPGLVVYQTYQYKPPSTLSIILEDIKWLPVFSLLGCILVVQIFSWIYAYQRMTTEKNV